MPAKRVDELDQQQLFDFADRTWHKESEARHHIPFKSENERVQYLQQSKEGRDTVHKIVKNLDDQRSSAKDEKELFEAYNTIYNYILLGYGFAFQFVKEAWLRREYIRRITAQAKAMVEEAEKAAGDVHRLELIAGEAAWWRNVIKDYVGRSQTTHGAFLSKWMKRNNMTIEDLMKKYMKKLGLRGPFRDLEQFDKVKVWNKIIEKSGQSRFAITRDLSLLGALGLSVLGITAVLVVLDIGKSQDPLETAVKDGLNWYAAHKIAIDGCAVKFLKTVYGDYLPPKYENNAAVNVFGENVVTGDVTAGEAEIVAEGVQGDVVTIQVVNQGAEDIEAAGEEATNYVASRYAVAEETSTLIVASEEAVEGGGLLACGLAGGAPLAFLGGLVVVEFVAGYAAGIYIGKAIDKVWEGLHYIGSLYYSLLK